MTVLSLTRNLSPSQVNSAGNALCNTCEIVQYGFDFTTAGAGRESDRRMASWLADSLLNMVLIDMCFRASKLSLDSWRFTLYQVKIVSGLANIDFPVVNNCLKFVSSKNLKILALILCPKI